MTAPVALFGLGLIGTAIARNLIADGRQVLGFDPDSARRDAFAGIGGTVSEAPETLWQEADIVLIAVFDTAQVGRVLDTAPRDSAATAVVLTTCDPAGIVALGHARPDLRLVEATISGTSGEVARRAALFMLGGAPGPVAIVRDLLDPLARGCRHVGPFGDGTRSKLAVNLILGLNRAALAEGLVLAQALGLDPATFLETARDSAASSAVMATKGPRMVSGDFSAEGRVRQSAKDFDLIIAEATTAGQDLVLARGYRALMEDCLEAGEGDLDNAAVISAVRRQRG